MKMKSLAAIVAVAAIAATASAQRPGMGGPGGPGGMRGPMSPQQQADMVTQRMTQAAGLNAAQQAKVKAIVLKSALEVKKIRDAQAAALRKVLTPAQMQKVLAERGMGRMLGMPGGPGRGPGGPGMGRPGMGRPPRP